MNGQSPFGMPMIEITHIRYVIAAASHGSFRRAAENLDIRQSSISRGIRSLEDQLGVSLLERSHAGVRLTAAGQRFVTEVAPALERLELAQKAAATAGRAEIGLVRIGILTSLAGGALRDIISHYIQRHPKVRIDVRDGNRADHLAAIHQGRLDVAFLTGADDLPQCESAELWHERVYVALNKYHRLASRRKLDWPDLSGEHFILSRLLSASEIHDYISRRAANCGACTEIEILDARPETLMNLVSLGQGVTLVLAAGATIKLPGLIIRPLISDEDIVPISAIWSAKNDNPALRQFLSAAHVLAGRKRRGTSDWFGLASASYPASGSRPRLV